MAKVQMLLPDDFLQRLSKLGDKTDSITKEVLKAGGEVVLKKVQSNLAEVVGKDTKYPPRSTGELESSLGVSDPLMDKNGNFNVKVGFAEPRSDGESNAKLANILEYGKHGQPAKPFLAPARRSVKKQCEAAMKAKFEEEINKL